VSAAGDDAPARPEVGRVEAFSDGVIAIIVTIMVLELHPPEDAGWDKLWHLWPTFLAYVLSYAYVALYWANHHRLFSHATRVTNGLIWSNMLLLFTLSLVPFATAYLGDQHFSRAAMWVYLGVLLLSSLAWPWLQAAIRTHGRRNEAARLYHRRTTRKGWFATAVYLFGMALTFVSLWLGAAAAALVAIFWFLPTSRIDKLFARG
jgi:uncharacterized membrane protein